MTSFRICRPGEIAIAAPDLEHAMKMAAALSMRTPIVGYALDPDLQQTARVWQQDSDSHFSPPRCLATFVRGEQQIN